MGSDAAAGGVAGVESGAAVRGVVFGVGSSSTGARPSGLEGKTGDSAGGGAERRLSRVRARRDAAVEDAVGEIAALAVNCVPTRREC